MESKEIQVVVEKVADVKDETPLGDLTVRPVHADY